MACTSSECIVCIFTDMLKFILRVTFCTVIPFLLFSFPIRVMLNSSPNPCTSRTKINWQKTLHSTMMMTSDQVLETSITVTDNSPLFSALPSHGWSCYTSIVNRIQMGLPAVLTCYQLMSAVPGTDLCSDEPFLWEIHSLFFWYPVMLWLCSCKKGCASQQQHPEAYSVVIPGI